MRHVVLILSIALCGACSAPTQTETVSRTTPKVAAAPQTPEAAPATSEGASGASGPAAEPLEKEARVSEPAPPPETKPVAVAAVAAAVASPEIPGEVTKLFEADKELLGWRFDHGGEFPGAKGGLSVDAAAERNGSPTLKLSADLTGGGAYVQTLKDLPGIDVETISFWLKTDVVIPMLAMRVCDQEICHQISLKVEPTSEWQRITLPLRTFFKNDCAHESVAKYESWGGVNDRRWHGPCKMLCVLTGAPPGGKKVSLWINDLAITQLPEKATTTVLPVALNAPRSAPGASVKIRYNWQPREPLPRDNLAFVHFVDAKGKTVAQDDHTPSVVTGSPGWTGHVSYERRVLLPAKLADGSYRILMGLYHRLPTPPGWKREPLLAGPGVKDDGERRFEVGTLVIDKTAPLPEADTEKAPSLDLSDFEMTFNEDFTTKLDISRAGPGTRWIAHTPWWGDFGDAVFADPREGFPFTIENGILRIEARKDENLKDGYNRKWEAGLIASNDPKGNGFSQQYGYFVCRAKLPPGPGVWPAFWLMSSFDRSKKGAGDDGAIEIDVIEFYGHNPGAYQSAVHTWLPAPHSAVGSTITTKMGEVSSGFHDFGVMVEPDFVTMYFDGVEVWKTPTPKAHNKPLMLLANLALGSGWPIDKTPDPSYMYIEHIRAYAKKK